MPLKLAGYIELTIAARIHAKYPRVLIEMHDMIAGGSPIRHTPLYCGDHRTCPLIDFQTASGV